MSTRHLTLIVLPSRGQERRLGVSAGRRLGGAVQRNRVKRLAREVFRRNRELFPSACDTVILARPGSERLDYASVRVEIAGVAHLLARAASRATRLERPKSS